MYVVLGLLAVVSITILAVMLSRGEFSLAQAPSERAILQGQGSETIWSNILPPIQAKLDGDNSPVSNIAAPVQDTDAAQAGWTRRLVEESTGSAPQGVPGSVQFYGANDDFAGTATFRYDSGIGRLFVTSVDTRLEAGPQPGIVSLGVQQSDLYLGGYNVLNVGRMEGNVQGTVLQAVQPEISSVSNGSGLSVNSSPLADLSMRATPLPTDATTVQYVQDAVAGVGGGPGGVVNQYQFNDGSGGFSGSSDLARNPDGTIAVASDLVAQGKVQASSLVATGTVSGDSVSATDEISGARLNIVGAITGGSVDGATVTSSGDMTAQGRVTGASMQCTGMFDGVTVVATGNISGVNVEATNVVKGAAVVATGNVQGSNVEATNLLKGATVEATGNIEGANVEATNLVKGVTVEATVKVQGANVEATDLLKGANVEVVTNATVGGKTTTNSLEVTADASFQGTLTAENLTANSTMTAHVVESESEINGVELSLSGNARVASNNSTKGLVLQGKSGAAANAWGGRLGFNAQSLGAVPVVQGVSMVYNNVDAFDGNVAQGNFGLVLHNDLDSTSHRVLWETDPTVQDGGATTVYNQNHLREIGSLALHPTSSDPSTLLTLAFNSGSENNLTTRGLYADPTGDGLDLYAFGNAMLSFPEADNVVIRGRTFTQSNGSSTYTANLRSTYYEMAFNDHDRMRFTNTSVAFFTYDDVEDRNSFSMLIDRYPFMYRGMGIGGRSDNHYFNFIYDQDTDGIDVQIEGNNYMRWTATENIMYTPITTPGVTFVDTTYVLKANSASEVVFSAESAPGYTPSALSMTLNGNTVLAGYNGDVGMGVLLNNTFTVNRQGRFSTPGDTPAELLTVDFNGNVTGTVVRNTDPNPQLEKQWIGVDYYSTNLYASGEQVFSSTDGGATVVRAGGGRVEVGDTAVAGVSLYQGSTAAVTITNSTTTIRGGTETVMNANVLATNLYGGGNTCLSANAASTILYASARPMLVGTSSNVKLSSTADVASPAHLEISSSVSVFNDRVAITGVSSASQPGLSIEKNNNILELRSRFAGYMKILNDSGTGTFSSSGYYGIGGNTPYGNAIVARAFKIREDDGSEIDADFRIMSTGGSVYIEPGPGKDTHLIQGDLLADVNLVQNIGSSSRQFRTVYCLNVVDSSDERLKSNIQPLANALPFVCSLPALTYDMHGTKCVGHIAQDTMDEMDKQPVPVEMVHLEYSESVLCTANQPHGKATATCECNTCADCGCTSCVNHEEAHETCDCLCHARYMMNYTRLVPFLVASVQTLESTLRDALARIASLEAATTGS